VDRVDLESGSGTAWREVLFEKLSAQAVTENTTLDNPQQFDDSAISITPQLVQIQTFISDKVGRNLNKKAFGQMGKLAGEAMMRKRDEDGLTAADGSTQMGAAGTPVQTGDVAAARYRITSNATEPGPMPIAGVFHGFCIKDFFDELVSGIGTYAIPDGATATVFQSGFTLPIANVSIHEDGNIAISGNDAKNFVFSKSAWILVNGMTLRTETRREPHIGGGGDSVFLTDEYAYGERSSGNWSFEIIGDATAPA